METIYKYELDVFLDEQTINMPDGAEILTIQTQNGRGQMWVKVDPHNPLVSRRFKTFGTGQELSGDTYVGTYQIQEGRFVFHVFEQHPKGLLSL